MKILKIYKCIDTNLKKGYTKLITCIDTILKKGGKKTERNLNYIGIYARGIRIL